MTDYIPDHFKDARQAVEHKLLRAALEYFEFSQAAGFRLQIPDTDPPMYIALGERELIQRLMIDA